MQSKRSCSKLFNGALFRKNLMRWWPMWGIASFGGSMVPLFLLMQTLQHGWTYSRLDFTEYYYGAVCYVAPVVLLVYASMCAVAVWSYLYQARSVGLMHSLPLRRECLFVTGFLSGMAMLLIPFAVVGGLSILLAIGCGAFDAVSTLVTIAAILGEAFFYFSTATAVAFVTGNQFAMPFLYFIFHFLAVGVDYLVSMLARGFLFGFSGYYTGSIEWLSPTVYLISRMNVNTEYSEVEIGVTGYGTNGAVSCTLNGAWIIAAYAAVGVVLMIISWLLYQRRRSESAGDVVAVGWMKPVFLVGVTVMSALSFGQGMYVLLFDIDENYHMLPMAITMTVAGLMGYYAASMLLNKTLRVFRGSWRGAALTLVGCLLLCGFLATDALGITRRVPEVDSISRMELEVGGNSYRLTPEKDAELIRQIREVHTELTRPETQAEIRQRLEHGVWGGDSGEAYTTLYLNYRLKNGFAVQRNYRLVVNEKDMEQVPDSISARLDRLVNGSEMKLRRLHADDDWTLNSVSLDIYYGGDVDSSPQMTLQQGEQILQAVKQDALEGTWGTYDWFNRDWSDSYAMDLGMEFIKAEPGYELDPHSYSHRLWDYLSIVVWPEMTHTVDTLVQLGLVERENLKTYAELDAMNAMDSSEWMAEEWWNEAAAEEPVESIGVIGGADGTTAIMLTSAN